MATFSLPPTDAPATAEPPEAGAPDCILTFNASDPSGAGGLTADITAVASVGGHPLAVVTGAYVRDTAEILDHVAFDAETVTEQARTVLEDVPVQMFKVGFVGSPENVGAIAEILSDYADVPVIAFMPNLSWWDESRAGEYEEAVRELLLSQTTVLVGSHSTLSRWLLPEWEHSRSPNPRDLAKAAAELGVPYTLVTSVPLPEQFLDNVLCTPQQVICRAKFERIEAVFSGAGDTLSAVFAALLGAGVELPKAATEALGYLDRCLDNGFRPGMGHALPDRMFWAQSDEPEAADDAAGTSESSSAGDATSFDFPSHETKH